MTRLIDADALIEKIIETAQDLRTLSTKTIGEAIHKTPTIDAVPVIRCKDCKYYEETDETIGTCLLTASGAHVKGYCAWAEPKVTE